MLREVGRRRQTPPARAANRPRPRRALRMGGPFSCIGGHSRWKRPKPKGKKFGLLRLRLPSGINEREVSRLPQVRTADGRSLFGELARTKWGVPGPADPM